jgi:hypothetical protein
MAEEQDSKNPKPHGILDTVSYTRQNETLRNFNPQSFVSTFLDGLKLRERQILSSRYGLDDGQPQTLEEIGKRLGLTRERVRQIEKETTKKLQQKNIPVSLEQTVDLIFQIIEDSGNIAIEEKILDTLLAANKTEVGRKAILFVLNLAPRFNRFKETNSYSAGWSVTGFDVNLLEQIISAAQERLETAQKPLRGDILFDQIRKQINSAEIQNLTNEALDSYTSMSKQIDKNVFQEWGLAKWTDIHPKDVGDKVYLVLSHHGKPEHYSKITELINKQSFDKRTAHKETVHNELIKDDRFVLVGRGIYALTKWGYKKGVVADIIKETLQKSPEPLTRDQLIEQVLKQRLVKRNTIIVGLSNRKLFRKTSDNKYTNV